MSVLVIAFDGLDKDLIEQFELEDIKLDEYGGIDNNTEMTKRKTSELFASFITGENHVEHGIKGLNKWDQPRGKIIDYTLPKYLLQNVRGFHKIKKVLEEVLNTHQRFFDRRDITSETLFDKIDNSKALDIPSYNPSPFWVNNTQIRLSESSLKKENLEYFWDEWEFERRKRNLFRPINTYFDLTMAHFHRPDIHQHRYGDKDINYDERRLRELYKETDKLAKKIIDFFEDEYDTIIFMSDHGLPTETQHNENAFYSCNKELFGDKTPKITDFHDKILNLID